MASPGHNELKHFMVSLKLLQLWPLSLHLWWLWKVSHYIFPLAYNCFQIRTGNGFYFNFGWKSIVYLYGCREFCVTFWYQLKKELCILFNNIIQVFLFDIGNAWNHLKNLIRCLCCYLKIILLSFFFRHHPMKTLEDCGKFSMIGRLLISPCWMSRDHMQPYYDLWTVYPYNKMAATGLWHSPYPIYLTHDNFVRIKSTKFILLGSYLCVFFIC